MAAQEKQKAQNRLAKRKADNAKTRAANEANFTK